MIAVHHTHQEISRRALAEMLSTWYEFRPKSVKDDIGRDHAKTYCIYLPSTESVIVFPGSETCLCSLCKLEVEGRVEVNHRACGDIALSFGELLSWEHGIRELLRTLFNSTEIVFRYEL